MAPQAAHDHLSAAAVTSGTGASSAADASRTMSEADAPSSHGVGVHARGIGGTRLAWIGFAALVVAGMVVFWGFDALPFQDLPAHAGLIAMRHRFASSEFEQRFFVLAPHIGPYSLFRFLGERFVGVVGPVNAVRAIASLPVLATPLALAFARKRLFSDGGPAFAFVGLALSFGLMTLLGFASYLLGVSVMLVGVTLWLELAGAADRGDDSRATRRKEIIVAVFSPLVFVAHGHAFLIYLMLAFVSFLAAENRRRVFLRFRVLAPAIALAAWVAWLERGGTRPEGSAYVATNLVPHFQGLKDKLSLLLTPTLMTRTGVDLLVGVAFWGFAVSAVIRSLRSNGASRVAGASTLSAPQVTGGQSSEELYSRSLRWGAIALFVIFAALPHSIGWFGFVDGRLLPIVLYWSLLSLRRGSIGRYHRAALEWGAPIAATAIVSGALVASYRFQVEARGYREVLAKVPVHARLLNLPLDPNSDVFAAHPFVHYDKLVLAERPIVVSDVWFHQGSALYPTPQNPALRLPSTYSESDLKFVDWKAYDLGDWDYVLMRTRPEAGETGAPASLHLIDHEGGWWLYTTQGIH